MEPDKSNLKLLPKPVVNTAARAASVNAAVAAVLTVVGFLVLWAPYYLLRTDTQLVLYPFVLLCIPVIWIFAVRAIIFGRRGRRWASASGPAVLAQPDATGLGHRASTRSIVVGIAALALPLPVFLFGGLPLQLLTAG
ncbi:hypothetical protein [Agreia sp. COWG]|uniref:hypothetical protein n=1 Tax=Agreia sp. COWG TaxID=2773266 RepID=UPI0019277DC6|nr:hypothetical protein [Agreia sp. COWG]CAD5989239.1 conserved membrane protein of unknown function [Agreia sp. COWG]